MTSETTPAPTLPEQLLDLNQAKNKKTLKDLEDLKYSYLRYMYYVSDQLLKLHCGQGRYN